MNLVENKAAKAGLFVNLTAIRANWRFLQNKVGKSICSAVVKTDAYGLGADKVAPALYSEGCRHFFTATLDEALAIYPLLPADAQLYVLHGINKSRLQDVVDKQNICPVISTIEALEAAQALSRPCWVHIDTGMNRLGFAPDALPDFSGLQILGVMSHLASADEPHNRQNDEQLRLFRRIIQQFSSTTIKSLAASSGIFLGAVYHADMVRAGIALYGGNPTPDAPNPMQAAVRLTAPIVQIRTINAGQTVGYGGLWQADRQSRIATLEAGYSEGLHRSLFSRGTAVIAGQRVPMVGRISMDLITVDITDIPEDTVKVGDTATLIGDGLTIDDVASAAGTISYEVITSLHPRTGRHYIT